MLNKLFLIIILGIVLLISFGFYLGFIYFPLDILNLYPLYHTSLTPIPHNTLISDSFTQFEPWRYFAKEQIAHGQFPLWNNLNGKGVPFFANGQSAVLFPLNFLYYFLPFSISLNLIPLLKLFLLFSFSYLYLKSIGISKNVSIIGSFAITFSGFSLVWLLWPQTNVFLFFPLLLFITEKLIIIKESNAYRWYFLLSLCYCLAILGGHPEMLLHILLFHSVYIIIRIGFQIKKLINIAFFIAIGFLLGAIQLLPLIEYLQNSYSILHRMPSPSLHLPIISFIFNIFPFILGAPNQSFYKAITSSTNFQEDVGLYTGLIVLLTSCIGAMTLFKKSSLVKFWTIAVIIIILLAYNVWPVGLLLNLPLLRQTSNGRLSSFGAFGLCVLFTFFIQNNNEIIQKYEKYIRRFVWGLVFFTVFNIVLLFALTLFGKFQFLQHPFIPLLRLHIIYILTTSCIFFLFMYFYQKRKQKISSITTIVIILFIASQTIGLLINYVPFISVKQYYPTPLLIKKLQTLPSGTVLEVGNPTIPPDMNMIYHIPLAQSYDAVEVNGYQNAFDQAFPQINQWGKVDSIKNINNLKKFGISYVLSDYNLNFSPQSVQPFYNTLLGPLVSGKNEHVSFVAKQSNLSEIRLLSANYNRRNTCTIILSISDSRTNQQIVSRMLHCYDFLDKMYKTLELGNVSVVPGRKYLLQISSHDGYRGNSIGFWGNKQNTPYLELFYYTDLKDYKFIGEQNGVKLFKIPNISDITLTGIYNIIHSTSTEITFEYITTKDTYAQIKIPFYPGWKASIDGNPTRIDKSNPFMKIKIPRGEHIATFDYIPISFIFGFIISLISAICLLLYFLRKEKQQPWVKNFLKKWQLFAKKNKNITLSEHTQIIFFGLIISILTYLSILKIRNPKFILPYTTAINWYTVHHYPRQQDYFYFVTGFITIILITFLIWCLWLWQKSKK